MALSLLGQDIDETEANLSLLGFNLVNLTLNGKIVWTKRAKGGSIKIGHTGVISESGTAVGTVHKNSDGNFLFTPPADLYAATINLHGAGGGGGGGEGGESWGQSEGSGGGGGQAGSESFAVPISTTPHIAIPFSIGKGGAGGGGGNPSENDGTRGSTGGSCNWQGNHVTNGGGGGAGGTGHYVLGGPVPQSSGGKGVDSSIGTGGAGGGAGGNGGTGGQAAGGGGGGGGDADNVGDADAGGDGGVGGTGIIEIIW